VRPFASGLLILGLSALVPLQAHAAPSCPGFIDGRASQPDADRVYAGLALDAVRAGLAKDFPTLGRLVSPDARFEIWRGDASTSWTGPAGFSRMLGEVEPRGFQGTFARPGPVAIVLRRCVWDVTLLLRTKDPRTGVSMQFRFVDGRLTAATGREVEVLEGDIR
jgi:hypothetical protein